MGHNIMTPGQNIIRVKIVSDTGINTAEKNVILKQSVIIVILLSKFSLIYLPY